MQYIIIDDFFQYTYYLICLKYNLNHSTISFCIINSETNKMHVIKIENIECIEWGNYGNMMKDMDGIKSFFQDDQFELHINTDQYKCIVEDFCMEERTYNDEKKFFFKKDKWIDRNLRFNLKFDSDEINFLFFAHKLYVDQKEILL